MAAVRVEPPFERPVYVRVERPVMGGLSQRGVRVGRRKPVIQSNPTSEILTGSPTAGDGRVREVTNGSFGAAKLVESLGT